MAPERQGVGDERETIRGSLYRRLLGLLFRKLSTFRCFRYAEKGGTSRGLDRAHWACR